jgi:phosphoribosylformylglycinamidine synthase
MQKNTPQTIIFAGIWKPPHPSMDEIAVRPIHRYFDGAAQGGTGRHRRQEQAMKAQVTVTLKSGVLDPQGKAIEGALKSLGVPGIASVRQGKVFDIEIDGGDRAAAEAQLREAAERLLANTVIENYDVKLIG